MSNVRRVYVEKKPAYAVQAKELKHEISSYLGIKTVTAVHVYIRYDVENISEEVFEKACTCVFSEPPVDVLYKEQIPMAEGARVFSVEYLPGQFDQRVEIQFEVINVRFNVEQVADLPRHDAHFEQRLFAVEFAADRFGIQVAVERFGGRVVQVDTEFFQHFFSRAP